MLSFRRKLNSKELQRNFLKIYSSSFCHFIMIFSFAILIFSITIVQGAENDKVSNLASPQNCLNKRFCHSQLPSPTPREQKQSDSLSQFLKWLFQTPSSTLATSKVPSKTPPTKLISDKQNQIPVPNPVPKTTPKSVVHSIPLEGTTNKPSAEDREERSLKKEDGNVVITDVQESIGAEVDPADVYKVNVKYGLDLAQKLEHSAQATVSSLVEQPRRVARDLRRQRDLYKPIKVPYTKASHKSSFHHPVDAFQRRQLLLHPIEQQQQIQQQQQAQAMLAIQAQHQQQQQAAAAAAAILQHQMLSGSRLTSLLDDYDDHDHEEDDESDEDSDEFDDFSRFGPPPVLEHHMYFRSGADGQPLGSDGRQRREDQRPHHNQGLRRGNKKGKTNSRYSDSRASHWVLDDYDLHSDVNSKVLEQRKLRENLKGEEGSRERIELDEQEHFQRHQSLLRKKNKKGGRVECTGNGCRSLRQDDAEGSDGGDNSETSTEGGSSSTTEEEMMSSSSSSTTEESSTSEASSTTDDSSTTTEGSSSTTIGLGLGSSTVDLGGPDLSSTTLGADLNITTTAATDLNITTTEASLPSSSSSPSSSTQTPKPKPPYKATLDCRCGTQSVRGVGTGNGNVARVQVNPWLVALNSASSNGSRTSNHLCSGSIINDMYVLTSKTCVENVESAKSLSIVAGAMSRKVKSVRVSKIVTHPKFNMALLKLNSRIKPTSNMRPICIPIGKRYAGNYSTATLVTFKKTPASVQMVDTEVGLMSDSDCSAKEEGMFCAGSPGSVKCGGDSGGVLMVYRGGFSYEQIGVVADTVGCRSKNTPGIYTDVRKRTRWILLNSKEGNYCKSPKVTDEDLNSTKRFGDPAFALDEDDDDSDELDDRNKEDYGLGVVDDPQSSEEVDDLIE